MTDPQPRWKLVRDRRPPKRYTFVALAAAVIGLIAWRSLRKRTE